MTKNRPHNVLKLRIKWAEEREKLLAATLEKSMQKKKKLSCGKLLKISWGQKNLAAIVICARCNNASNILQLKLFLKILLCYTTIYFFMFTMFSTVIYIIIF